MALEPVDLELDQDLPRRLRQIIRRGEEVIESFGRHRRDGELAGFVPADHQLVALALLSLREHPLLAGDLFLEWGSGLGIITMVAAEIGYEAQGIEILPELVDQAEELADELGVSCAFVCGSCVPTAAQDAVEEAGEGFWIGDGGLDGHELLDLDPADADLVYAYPWPGEQGLFERLFDRVAGSGALFLSYNGVEGLRLLRKC